MTFVSHFSDFLTSYILLLYSLTVNLISFFSFPDVLPKESNREGGGGAETETAEVRADPPGQPDQGAGLPQENGGGLLLVECPLTVFENSQFTSKFVDTSFLNV